MATKKPTTPVLMPANLNAIEMANALPRLRKRLSELESFSVTAAPDEVGAAAKALQQKYDDLLIEIFGPNTIEYDRFSIRSFYYNTGALVMSMSTRTLSHEEKVRPYQKGVQGGVNNLRTVIEIFEEKVGESTMPPTNSFRTLESLNLHPDVADAVMELFKGGHYANAIEDACKVLDLMVKMKSKRSDPSGTELMQLVFSQKNPILKFNDQANDSEKSEQQGMMYLYSGTMLAFRNPRAHGLLTDDPIVALEIIGFVNFLAKALHRTKRS